VVSDTYRTATLDPYDTGGKRILSAARRMPTQGSPFRSGGREHLCTVIGLGDDLALDTFLVRSTAGDKVFTERLVVH